MRISTSSISQRYWLSASASLSVILGGLLLSPGCRFQARPSNWFEPGSVPVSQLGCLEGASDTLALYLEGKASGTRARDVFTCANQNVQMFTNLISGEKPGEYSINDLRNFTQVFFLRTFKISDSLLREILTVKKALLGGNNETLSSRDMDRIRRMTDILGRHAEILAQDQPITLDHAREWTPTRMDAAVARMTQAGEELASWLTESSGAYRFEDFITLLDHLESGGAFAGSEAEKIMIDVRRWMPFIRAAKSAIIDGNSDLIASKDWGTLVRLAVRAYTLVLRIDHFRQSATDWVSPEDRYQLVGMARNALALFTDALKRHPNPWLTFEELERLIDLVPMDLPVKRQTLKAVLRPIALKLFGPTAPSVGPGLGPSRPIGIQLSTIAQIQKDLELWAQTQDHIDREYLGRPFVILPPLNSLEAAPFAVPRQDIQRRLNLLASKGGPNLLFVESEPRSYRLFIGKANWTEPLRYWEMTVRNWTRMIAAVAIRGYTPRTEDPTPHKIEFRDYLMMFRDFEPLLQQVGILDPSVPITDLTMDEQFHVGDYVSFSSNGDNLIDEAELSEQLMSLFSSRDLGYDLKTRVDIRCARPTTPCVRQTLLEEFDFLYANFPGLSKDWRSWSLADRMDVIKRIEFLAFKKTKGEDETYIYAELFGIGAALHQLELSYGRYDVNVNGELDYGEVMRALPIFGPPLQAMSKAQGGAMGGLIQGDWVGHLLTYIVSRDEPAGFFTFFPWALFPDMRKAQTHVTRLGLIRRFAALRATQPAPSP